MNPVKLVVTSKKKLQFKYGKEFSAIEKALNDLVRSDKQKQLDTKIIFIDDGESAKKAGIKKAKTTSAEDCKRAVDDLYKKYVPAYIMIIGAQDVIPFHEIINPASDDDKTVPSDLPYACDAPYGSDFKAFTGPTRVIGRLPDVPGASDAKYLLKLIKNIIKHKPLTADAYMKYFSVTASVWEKSTALSLQSMFNESERLFISPATKNYTATNLKSLTHFINCHGAHNDVNYYGQKGDDYPIAMQSSKLINKISDKTIVAAECCYGAELVDPSLLENSKSMSIANTYFDNNAIAFLGSSTIAYGPSDTQGLADLLTQYFIQGILCGASTGRALLEARQKFLTVSAPHLDPYESKTLAQFYLLGDPSISPVISLDTGITNKSAGNSVENRRINLYNKGVNLSNSLASSKEKKTTSKSVNKKEINKILQSNNFENAPEEVEYNVRQSKTGESGLMKTLGGTNATFRAFIKPKKDDGIYNIKVLVVKENPDQVLGWRMYESR